MFSRILVTGGAGFIGSTFVAQAAARGQKVYVLDALTYAGHMENITWIPSQANVEFIKGNICEGDLVIKILKDYDIEAVVNFAAESHVDNSISSPTQFIETNIRGTYTLLESCRNYWQGLSGPKKENFRYLQISTDEVFGELRLDDEKKFSESHTMHPSSPYSSSKAAGDHLTYAWYKTYGMPTITTNCSNNFGPRQHPEKLIPRMIVRAIKNKTLTIHGNGKNVRDWIHVEDHCNGVYLALTKGKPGETYCLGGNDERPNIEIIEKICDIFDDLSPRQDGSSYRSLMQHVTDRPGNDLRYAIDDTKAQEQLGFKRQFNLESGLKTTIEWYLSNPEWVEKVMGGEYDNFSALIENNFNHKKTA